MIRSIRILIPLVFVSCILSCKKDKDDDKNGNSNQTRLARLVQYLSASPAKGIITTEFIYDDQQRVVEMATFSGDSVGNEIRSAKIRSLKFSYNGNEKTPSKTIGALPYGSSPIAEIYHKYNSTAALVQDSIPAVPVSSYNQRTIRSYVYTGSKIMVQTESRDIYGYSIYSRDSFLLENNNLVQAYYSGNSTGYMLKYDDKINPISKLNIASLVTTCGINGFPSYLAPGACKNNITEYTYGYSYNLGQFTPQGIYYFTYFYNANNLPFECRYVTGNTNYIVRYYYID